MLKVSKVLFLCSLIVTLFVTSYAQQTNPDKNKPEIKDDDVVRVDTRLVTIHVSVMDRDGKFIPDLQKELFQVFEDKNEQNIAFFETTNSPFTVMLMLDTSDSTIIQLNEIQDAAIAFVSQLRPDDRVAVLAFDSNVVKLCDATSDRKTIYNSILSTRTGGGTSLYTAVDTTVNSLFRNIKGRKAIVLFTDGIDTTSRATYDDTEYAAKESDAIIYTIQYPTSHVGNSGQNSNIAASSVNIITTKGEPIKVAYERGTRYLQALSSNSGGRFYFADTVKSLTKSFAYIAKELSQQYSISYYPANQDTKRASRQIKVTVNSPKAVVRSRRNYVFK